MDLCNNLYYKVHRQRGHYILLKFTISVDKIWLAALVVVENTDLRVEGNSSLDVHNKKRHSPGQAG